MRVRALRPAMLGLGLGAGLALSACTVGRDHAGPPPLGQATPQARFARADPAAAAPAEPALADWWRVLGDATLDALEVRALQANGDVAIAAARLRQSRAALRAQRLQGRPTIDAQGTYLHARLPGLNVQDTDGGGDRSDTFDFFNLGGSASWELDLFGGQRRALEADAGDAAAARARLADAQVSVTADVAQAYVGLRDRQRRIALAARGIALGEEALALTRRRIAGGTAAQADLDQMAQQLEAARLEAAPLAAERDACLDRLAVLLGVAPGTLDAELAGSGGEAAIPLPPAAVAVGDPAALLRRRPDIRAAERELAADTARVGVAQAQRFPRVKFMGILGLGGTDPGDVFDPGRLTTLLAPQISWSFLDFGRGRARVDRAEARRDETEARYRTAVLAGLEDAEGSLARFRDRRAMLGQRRRALASFRRLAGFGAERERAGTASRLDTIEADRRRLAAEGALAAEEAALTIAFVGVERSLGLGWR